MSIKTKLEKTALYLRNARNAVIGRGGEISATAGFKDLPDAITNIPNDQTLAWQTVESNAKRVTVPNGVLPMAQIKKIGGMSYKCNNLIPYPYRDGMSKENNGITYIVNDDGSITANGTATARSTFYLRDYSVGSLQKGTYSLSGCPKGDGSYSYYLSAVFYSGSTYVFSFTDYGDGKTYEITKDFTHYDLSIVIKQGAVCNNLVFKPMFNIGSILPYEPYFEGIRDSKTTSIVSEGANLLDVSKAVNANFIDNGDGTYTLTHNGGTQRFSANMPLNIPANTPIAFKGILISGDASVALDFKFTDGTESDSLPIDNYSRTRTYEKDIISARFFINYTDTGKSAIFSNNQIVYGTTAKEYKPFVGIQANVYIPEAVKALEGYGLGINADYYNYVEWREGRYYLVQNALKYVVDGKTQVVASTDNASFHYNEYRIATPKIAAPMGMDIVYLISTHFTPATRTEVYNRKIPNTICITGTQMRICSSYETAEEVQAHLAEQYAQGNPLTVIYALAEPIETDITDLMTVDNHIAVEGGGTVEFNNEYGYDIPNEINYLFNTAGG